MFKTKTLQLPSGRKIKVLLGQRLTKSMLEALDEQREEMDK